MRALAESLKVLGALELQTRDHPRDAAAWFHQGTLAYTLSHREPGKSVWRGPRVPELDAIALKSFQTATELDPRNGRHWYALARFLATGSRSEREQWESTLKRALAEAQAARDTLLLIATLDDLGSVRWSRWSARNAVNDVPLPAKPIADASVRTLPTSRGPTLATTDAYANYIAVAGPTSGWIYRTVWQAAGADTLRDLEKFLHTAVSVVKRDMPVSYPVRTRDIGFELWYALLTELYTLAPDTPGLFRRIAAGLSLREQWSDLAKLALAQSARRPAEAEGWMVLGLAQQRMRMASGPGAAFDSGLARFSDEQRARFHVGRVLTWRDSVAYATAGAAKRAEIEKRTWLFADPLWSAGSQKSRHEFLARMTYADLLWTGGIRPAKGADSYHGDLYVRYGPPDERRGTFWLYGSELIFDAGARWGPTGRKKEGLEFRDVTERQEDYQPSRWANVTPLRVDSMRTRTARFRGTADSVDFFLATQSPTDTAQRNAAIARLWLFPFAGADTTRDSVTVTTNGALRWTRRLSAGAHYYRVETVAPGAPNAGRTSGEMRTAGDSTDEFSLAGFGMSDVLLATHIDDGKSAKRWTEYSFTPLTGDLAQGATIALVWENYELGAVNGSSSYEVKVTLERKYKMFINRLRARVIAVWAAMMGTEQTADRMVFRYERSASQAPVVADYLTLALEDAPAGNYDLSLEITDKATRKATSRTMRVVILE